jgi:hypothetical protein
MDTAKQLKMLANFARSADARKRLPGDEPQQLLDAADTAELLAKIIGGER